MIIRLTYRAEMQIGQEDEGQASADMESPWPNLPRPGDQIRCCIHGTLQTVSRVDWHLNGKIEIVIYRASSGTVSHLGRVHGFDR